MPEPLNENDIVPSRAQILAKLLAREEREIHGGMMRLRRRGLLDGLDA